jgi:hypothetical protein
MPVVGFEPEIPALDRAKRVHALARADAVIGTYLRKTLNKLLEEQRCENSNRRLVY